MKSYSPSYRAFAVTLTDIDVPRNIYDALIQPEWKEVAKEELNAQQNKT